MKELIRITEHNGNSAVSARELYEFLGFNKAVWSRWYKKNIINNQFAIENEDYQTINIMLNGNETIEFALSLDFAKKISMMARTDKGEEARQYFIECEKKAKSAPKTQIDILVQSALALQEHERRISTIEDKVNVLLEEKDKNTQKLKEIPFELKTEEAPELLLRDKIRLLVNRIASATSVSQSDIWNNIYQTLYYNYGIAIKSYKKEKKSESYLDVAERKGFLDKIFTIVSKIVKEKQVA